MISGILWDYYRDEVDNFNDNASDGHSFKYRTKTTRKTEKNPEMTEITNDHHKNQYKL